MQPYFFPYIGYYQLIDSVDAFIVYDQIQYTKKGWINRNKIKLDNKIINITLPLAKDSSILNINQRYISESWPLSRKKIINQIESSYQKTEYYAEIFQLIIKILHYDDSRLDRFLLNSIIEINKYLGIETKIIISSELEKNSVKNKGEKRVISLVKKCGGNTYVNLSGGTGLYNKNTFSQNGIELKFLSSILVESNIKKNIPNLSIIDLLMHNSIEKIRRMLQEYKLF